MARLISGSFSTWCCGAFKTRLPTNPNTRAQGTCLLMQMLVYGYLRVDFYSSSGHPNSPPTLVETQSSGFCGRWQLHTSSLSRCWNCTEMNKVMTKCAIHFWLETEVATGNVVFIPTAIFLRIKCCFLFNAHVRQLVH